MNLSYRTKFEGEVETLKLKRSPLMHGLGYYEDQDGKQWDVRCVYGAAYTKDGKPYINARPVDNSPYYSTATYGHSFGHHEWKPYYFEVINNIELTQYCDCKKPWTVSGICIVCEKPYKID